MIPSLKQIEKLNTFSKSYDWKEELEDYIYDQFKSEEDAEDVYEYLEKTILKAEAKGKDWEKDASEFLDNYGKQFLINKIKEIVNTNKDWKDTLKEILKEDKIDNLYFYLSQSILKDGAKRDGNDYLEYLNRVPIEALRKLESSTQELIYNLIDDDELNVYRSGWLSDPALYKNTKEDLEYIIKAIVFTSNPQNLRGYGDPKQVPKIIDNKGNFILDRGGKPYTAKRIKNLLTKWQKDTADSVTSDEIESDITGYDILRKQINKNKLYDMDIAEYIKNIDSIKDTLKGYSVDYIEKIMGDEHKKVLNKNYKYINDVEDLDKDLAKMISSLLKTVRTR